MAIDKVKAYFAEFGREGDVMEFPTSSATVEQAREMTGHAVGGVCPFAVNEDCDVYLDESLRRFDVVYPACGSSNSAIALTPDELAACTPGSTWVDVCKLPEEAVA